ncbi:MAG: phosphoribosylaminoimidazolesuccinocarboxamide synthase [PVC group bacterium]
MRLEPLLEVAIPGVQLFDRGKIRDIFAAGKNILVVTTDRVYLFERVWPQGLPGKGRVLTALSLRTFAAVRDLVPSYVITDRAEDYPPPFNRFADLLAGRSYLTGKVAPIRVECVVRGYLYGQAWKAYRAGDRSWLPPLPSGLELAAELPGPVFTPARKSRTGQDENLGRRELAGLTGEGRAEELERLSLAVYGRMRGIFAQARLILADTKFEFGEKDGRLLLINEACTPDCSRIWKEAEYRSGRIQDPWDKEILENYLGEKGWLPGNPPLHLPFDVLQRARERFAELASLI